MLKPLKEPIKNENLVRIYNSFTPEEKKKIIEEFFNVSNEERKEKFKYLYQNIFRKIPPTPEEFLDPSNGWVPEKIAESIFPHIKQDFIDILNKQKEYEQIVMYGCTRQGKSFLAVLLIVYTIIWMHCLKDPNDFYGVSSMKNLCIYILSFKYSKVYEVYLKPLYNFLHLSERFHIVKQQSQVIPTQKKLGDDVIVYSKAALVGVMTLASGLQVVCGNDDELAVIGADILQAYISEIAYFIKDAGASEEQIFQFYSKVSERITATVGRKYASFTYLDTSANMADSLIENYILKTLSKDPKVYFKSRSRWEARPELFPIYNETGETFTICTGDGSIAAKIFENREEINQYPPNLILNIPIDVIKDFKKDLLGSIRDIAGKPTSSETKFIPNRNLIDQIWCNEIYNFEGIMNIDSMDDPDEFIWQRLKDHLFHKYNETEYMLKRAPKEPRFIHFDLAFAVKGDITGFCMTHLEMSNSHNYPIHVIDLAFAIGPGENGINLKAIECFILDMVVKGQIIINSVTSDKFESKTILQNLEREGINTYRESIDNKLDPYMELYGALLNNHIRGGKNIFLKNNLDSLYRVRKDNKKEMIDHSAGELTNIYNGDWERSLCGKNAKDVSDSLAGCIFAANKFKEMPTAIFEIENEKVIKARNSNSNRILSNEDLKNIYKKLHKVF